MFTLKLYQNGPLPPNGRTVILEVAGIWVNHCNEGVKEVMAFKKKVGVEDTDGTPTFYVGGNPSEPGPGSAIIMGAGGNYYSWGVLENALGKTTEMFR